MTKSTAMRYDERPLLVYWEMTRACGLSCRHCRAEAIPWRDPLELSTEEGYTLLEKLAGFGEPMPHLVLTGGDPLMRPDLFELIGHARGLGFKVAVTPSGTERLTKEVMQRMRQAEVWMVAMSLDGSSPQRHDAVRGVDGSFAQTLKALRWAREAEIPVQVNTLVCAETLGDLSAIHAVVSDLDIAQWALFFLIGVGRAKVLGEVTPTESEEVMHWVYEMARHSPFRIRTTEAPHYRRVALQRALAGRGNEDSSHQVRDIRQGFGVRDGSGVMFISHTGEVYPSGFLPVAAGSVRFHDPVAVYRHAPLFVALRDPEQLKGRCGRCKYRQVCGGSRARAGAATGDPLESDPLCPYEPARRERPLSIGRRRLAT